MPPGPPQAAAPEAGLPVDHVAVARLYGEPLFALPQDLYIPPDALEVFLEAFEGPLDLLLYLIRKQNFNILDIPMAAVTRQYLGYVEQIRSRNLELAAEYLLMAATLIAIKSRMLLPPVKTSDDAEPEDPRAALVRRLLEYERIKLAAARLGEITQREFLPACIYVEQALKPRFPDVSAQELQAAWRDILRRARLVRHHTIKFVYPETDLVAISSPIALIKNSANRENGKLLYDYILSVEGRSEEHTSELQSR